MSSLPPALDFAKAEEEICAKWAEERTFKTQDKLGKERGDEVRLCPQKFLPPMANARPRLSTGP